MQTVDWIKHEADLNGLRAFFQDWQGLYGVGEIEMKSNIRTTRKKALELIGRIQEANKFGETQSTVAVPKTSLLSPEQICKTAFEASARRREDLIEEIRSATELNVNARRLLPRKKGGLISRFFVWLNSVPGVPGDKSEEKESVK